MRDFRCPFCGLRFWKASLTTLTSPEHTENDCPVHNQTRTSLHKSGNPAPRRRARRCKQSRHSRRRRSVQVQRHHLESLLLAYDEAGMRASGFWGLLSPPGTCRRRQATRHHEVQNSTEESTPLEQSAPMNLTPRPIMTRASRDRKCRTSFHKGQSATKGAYPSGRGWPAPVELTQASPPWRRRASVTLRCLPVSSPVLRSAGLDVGECILTGENRESREWQPGAS